MLTCVRWYVAYPLSLRHIEEMMRERGIFVDHATVHRWAIKMVPVLAAVFRRRQHPVGKRWRMDETYIKVAGQWKYLYRVVDRAGDTVVIPAHEEQIAIANVLSDIDAELSELETLRDKTRNIKQAMMQELLTGKTRLIAKEGSHV
ncbi:hypothetical protein MOLA814_02218 [Betaproteobacteria bacterium MOLA814]|nr:hypothetical protein MOLA814_02218 [Betaproteobacteria bacterium MOLA814]